jgi:hypothetical protein
MRIIQCNLDGPTEGRSTMTAFLFDSQGTWIAFRPDETDRNLFNSDGEWIGWFPWGDDDAVTREGAYLGTVVENRLLVREHPRFRGTPDFPGSPPYPGQPPYPGAGSYISLPDGFMDAPGSVLWPAKSWKRNVAS